MSADATVKPAAIVECSIAEALFPISWQNVFMTFASWQAVKDNNATWQQVYDA